MLTGCGGHETRYSTGWPARVFISSEKRPSMAAAVRAAARAASRVGVRSEAACRVASSVGLRTRLAASLIRFSSRRVR